MKPESASDFGVDWPGFRYGGAVAELNQRWQRGTVPLLEDFLKERSSECAFSVSERELVSLIGLDQRERWRRGERPSAEAYLQQFPQLAADDELALDVIYGEFLLREELGELTDVRDFQTRFPEFADTLLDQIEFHRAMAKSAEPAISERPGTQIGPYKLLQQIGEGGFGIVFMAEQTEPVRRRVALKVIKPGMDTRQVIARFEAERQALAVMDHPNIARVLDAGTTEAGRPYFVMDLVRGVPITRYCDEHHLTPRQRLELFIPVCQAIQHAHQKGIIHRDLKSNNVLVALYDGKPVPKVIDFGVAKAAGQTLTDKTLVTGFGAIVGTLEYMSPEQAEFNQLDIDTRSDIYSLGVLLYELLTGSTPFSRKGLEQAGMLEMLRVIREEEPSKPSTKLSTAEGLPTLAANRGIEPAKLTKLVRGELDWIVMKALEKDRNRRYETANGFAMDVQRYLADEPVRACPPSARYRLRKFARRNKGGLFTAAVVAVAVLVAVGGLGWGVRDRAAQRREAERGVEDALVEAVALRKQAAMQTKDPVQRQATLAAALSTVKRGERLISTGPSDRLRQRLAEMRAELEEKEQDARMVARLEEIRVLEGDPDSDKRETSKARAFRLYAVAFREYGIDLEALEPAASGQLIRQRAIRLELVAILDNWAWITPNEALRRRLRQIANIADPDGEEFTNRMRHAVADGDLDALVKLAEEAQVAALAPTTLADLGTVLIKMGNADKGVLILRRAQQQYPDNWWISRQLAMSLLQLNPPEQSEALRYLNAAWALRPSNAWNCVALGEVMEELGRFDEAIACYQKAIELDPRYAPAHNTLGNVLLQQGKPDEAIACYQNAIELDPKMATAYNDLGFTLMGQGKLDEAIACYQKAIELGPRYAKPHSSLGEALRQQGKLEEAIAPLRKAVELDPKDAFVHNNLGVALSQQGKLDEAIACYQKAIEIDPKLPGRHHDLGYALYQQGKLAEAVVAYNNGLAIDPQHATVHNALAWLLATAPDAKVRNPARAVELAKRAVELATQEGNFWITLGAAHYRAGDWKAAIAALEKSIQLRQGGNSFDWFFLAMAHWQLGHKDEARTWYDKAVEWMQKNGPKEERRWFETSWIELDRFHQEAAEMIGISDQQTRDVKSDSGQSGIAADATPAPRPDHKQRTADE